MHRIALPLLMIAALVVGCTAPKQTAGTSPTSDQAIAIRDSIKTNNPNAQVGFITYVLSENSLAMVADIDVSNLQVNNIVSILDSSENIVCHGRIAQIYSDNRIAISYDQGARAPSKGDVVVRF